MSESLSCDGFSESARLYIVRACGYLSRVGSGRARESVRIDLKESAKKTKRISSSSSLETNDIKSNENKISADFPLP